MQINKNQKTLISFIVVAVFVVSGVLFAVQGMNPNDALSQKAESSNDKTRGFIEL